MLVAMAIVLGLLVVSYGRRSVENEMLLASRYPTQNPSLNLEIDRDGILRVEGEGKLFGSDMDMMLQAKGIRSKAVTNVIIGDDITEIGYDALFGKRHLLTLKIGKNVRRIAAGALQSCVQLQYIYLPSGLEKVGGDFLFNCNDCLVITDGAAGDLPAMENVSEERLVEHVDSYETLLTACQGDANLSATLKLWWP